MVCFFTAKNSTLGQNQIPVYLGWGKSMLVPDSNYQWKDGLLNIEVAKIYIGDLEMYNHGIVINKASKRYSLIDLLDSNSSVALQSPLENFDSIRFQIGIDSNINQNGAHPGDLDPIHGMYWAWHSGYINFKLEGKYIKNGETKSIQYHIGGYIEPYQSAQIVTQKTEQQQNRKIFIDLEKVLKSISPDYTARIMQPSFEAVKFSKNLSEAIDLR